MAFRIQRRKDVNAIRVAMKIIGTIIALWVGGFAYNIVAAVMNGTFSPFYKGLKLVGFTMVDAVNSSQDTCGVNTCSGASCETAYNCLIGTNSTSLLAVIGVLAIFWIAFEFIDVRM